MTEWETFLQEQAEWFQARDAEDKALGYDRKNAETEYVEYKRELNFRN